MVRVAVVWCWLAAMASAQVAAVPKFTLVEWNIEAGGSDLEVIKQQLTELEPFDLVALSEVPTAAADQFASRWAKESSFVGTSGGPARLVVAWNPKIFAQIKAEEIKRVGEAEFAPGLQMAPLSIHLKHLGSGQEFLLVMTHLARGSAELRRKQALLMTELAQAQTLPVVAIGGFNFDYDFVKHQGNESFVAFTAGDTWKWIKPQAWVDSNWSDRNAMAKTITPTRCWTMSS